MAKKPSKIRILKQTEVLSRVVREMSPGQELWVPFKLKNANTLTSFKSAMRAKGITIQVDTTDTVYGVITILEINEANKPEGSSAGVSGRSSGLVSSSEEEVCVG